MATENNVTFYPTVEQKKSQWERLKKAFNLTDDHQVNENWSAEATYGGSGAFVTITLSKRMDMKDFNAMLNGLPLEEEVNETRS